MATPRASVVHSSGSEGERAQCFFPASFVNKETTTFLECRTNLNSMQSFINSRNELCQLKYSWSLWVKDREAFRRNGSNINRPVPRLFGTKCDRKTFLLHRNEECQFFKSISDTIFLKDKSSSNTSALGARRLKTPRAVIRWPQLPVTSQVSVQRGLYASVGLSNRCSTQHQMLPPPEPTRTHLRSQRAGILSGVNATGVDLVHPSYDTRDSNCSASRTDVGREKHR